MGIRAKSIRARTFDATPRSRAPFGEDLFDVTTANDVFEPASIAGSKVVDGDISETELASSVPAALEQGGSLELNGDVLAVLYVETNYVASANQIAAHLEGIDDALGAINPSTPISDNKDMVATVTASDGDLATVITLTTTPINDGYVVVEVNGHSYVVGDGVKTDDCYFSGDSGTTARNISDVIAGDTLHWNGTVAGFELDGIDRIDLHYDT